MQPELFHTLYAYNAWANERVLDTAGRLSPEQFFSRGQAVGSVHTILVHTMGAQWIWLSRWQGASPQTMLNPADFPDLPAVRRHWAAVEAETQAFVASLDEAALARIVAYSRTGGQPRRHPLWQLLLHQANHATQHRSEIAALLTGFGHSPGDLDLIVYLSSHSTSP